MIARIAFRDTDVDVCKRCALCRMAFGEFRGVSNGRFCLDVAGDRTPPGIAVRSLLAGYQMWKPPPVMMFEYGRVRFEPDLKKRGNQDSTGAWGQCPLDGRPWSTLWCSEDRPGQQAAATT